MQQELKDKVAVQTAVHEKALRKIRKVHRRQERKSIDLLVELEAQAAVRKQKERELAKKKAKEEGSNPISRAIIRR